MFQWLKARRERRDSEAFDRGFGWIMTRYYRHKEPTYYLTDCAATSFPKTPFYRGAEAALDMLPDPNEEWQAQQ